MNRIIETEIAGRKYLISTDENENYVSELSGMITTMVLDIKRKSGASTIDCLALTALTLADDLKKERKKDRETPAANAVKSWLETPTASVAASGQVTIPTASAAICMKETTPAASDAASGQVTIPTASAAISKKETTPAASAVVSEKETTPATSAVVSEKETTPAASVVASEKETPTESVVASEKVTTPTANVTASEQEAPAAAVKSGKKAPAGKGKSGKARS